MGARLSLPQARRIALSAQGLAGVRPVQPVNARAVGRAFAQLQLVQIDSVNIIARSHFLPFFSRLGNYDRTILATLSGRAPRKMMEYWAHEASYIRPEHFHDLTLWQNRTWAGSASLDPQLRDGLEREILALLASSRPLTAREVKTRIGHEEEKSRDEWGWNWSSVKRTLEGLFERGVVGAASRNEQFERRYTLVGNVLPPALRQDPGDGSAAPDGSGEGQGGRQAAMDRLMAAGARAHGIGTLRCFADYFRLPAKEAAGSVARLLANGTLERVEVDGWSAPTYLHTSATIPRKAQGRALLSPFDSLVFERRRLLDLFNFHYRLEIYTPAAKRKYGYYVLPFLVGETMAARVDLKADRQEGRLLVRGAFAEPDAPAETASALAVELALMAHWLGLDCVVVEPRGNLARQLAMETRHG
ncbi:MULTISPECIES: winged helix-turn-helix domain-containing protein [unclassified Arthrobacter]|uniref:winged helix-turn-helix domain-containing protein n=1 Tax=unclassified Arthrobacter TaxID=235627 RepID=UPI00159D22A1|nr:MULTISPECIES: crosslink repair DNA glycosylase YcaQ family protein [unclassified Arthrobacter]MCQ9163049.1 winged helix DNA-binding domain-containing protein [Arthrobacter sp. STN4]NVM97505.1 winged helix-turn-helix domain-containing protein [Arthrobacter sp. SDTb3-6]